MDDKAKVQSEASPLTGGSKKNCSKTSCEVKKARKKGKNSTKKPQGMGGIFSRLVGYNGQKKHLGNFKGCSKLLFIILFMYLKISTINNYS